MYVLLGIVEYHMLFLRAITDGYTTSAFTKRRKIQIIEKKIRELSEAAQAFNKN